MKIRLYIRLFLAVILAVLLLARSTPPPPDQYQRVRVYTRHMGFDYVTWAARALSGKTTQLALGTVHYYPQEDHKQYLLDYLSFTRQILIHEAYLREMYAHPSILDPALAAAPLSKKLALMHEQHRQMAPLAESILQSQVAVIAAEMGLTTAGQAVPPVLYKVTPLPLALIISPRDAIRQVDNVSLLPGLTLEQIIEVEKQVEENVDVSALIVPVGGIGLYPTMVMETTDLVWLAEIVAHEWIHNYLTLRPLGMRYMASPELRIMNETAASIAGKEIGLAVIERYYPEYMPSPPPPPQEIVDPPADASPVPAEPPPFSYRAELHQTRLIVDDLLAEGKIEQAEAYMEERRLVLLENGYYFRRLNQAYFAFYGAYADVPGGAAGRDIVGEAVRTLRAENTSLADFINSIGWMWSFGQLQRAVAQ